MLRLLFCSVILAISTSCKKPPQNQEFIPVVGLNKEGKSDIKYIPTSVFKEEMSPFIGNMADEVSSTLDREENLQDLPWTLSRVTVGLEIEGEFGLLEDALEAEGKGEIELRFQKIN